MDDRLAASGGWRNQSAVMRTWIMEARFSAAHLYHQPKWSVEENKNQFGRCFTKHGHGHNYRLTAEWKGIPLNEVSHVRGTLDQIVAQLDHEHLNFVIPEFKTQIPTTENICEYLRKEISRHIPYPLIRVTLYEDHDIGASTSL